LMGGQACILYGAAEFTRDIDLAYFLDHSLVQSLRAGEADVGALRAADGIAYTAFGPLWLLPALAYPVLAYLGLRLAVQYREAPKAPPAPLLLMVSSGFILGGLFDGANRLTALTALLDSPGPFPWLPWGWAVAIVPVTAFVPSLLAVAVLASNRPPADRPHRKLERTVVMLSGFALFSGFVRLIAPSSSDVAGGALVLLLLGAWRLATPAFIAYGLLRYPPQPQPLRTPTSPAAEPKPRPTTLESAPTVR
ncbi:MAG TPA: hypothetical protein VJ874_07160, partial [Candidatus Thermoplasmatota archaeon]|nr:hypothetical protein [Candidatus Thermoplasmatota archaeon]